MIIHDDITDAIGHSSFCLTNIDRLRSDVGNPKNINPTTYQNNVGGMKDMIMFYFKQYLGIRKTYNHEIIEVESELKKLEKDFEDIISTIGNVTVEQVTQLEGVIFKIQKLIVGQIRNNPTYYLHLQQNFPKNFP